MSTRNTRTIEPQNHQSERAMAEHVVRYHEHAAFRLCPRVYRFQWIPRLAERAQPALLGTEHDAFRIYRPPKQRLNPEASIYSKGRCAQSQHPPVSLATSAFTRNGNGACSCCVAPLSTGCVCSRCIAVSLGCSYSSCSSGYFNCHRLMFTWTSNRSNGKLT